MKMIKLIVAADDKYGIAKDGKIPWHSKEDFKFFRETTIGSGNNVVMMGRKTMESLPKFPLPHRKNIVITSKPDPQHDYEVNSLDKIAMFVKKYDDVFIIGGGYVYQESIKLNLAKEIFISRIPGDFNCDKFLNIEDIKQYYVLDEIKKFETFNVEVWHLIK